jgi:hypothetical protein
MTDVLVPVIGAKIDPQSVGAFNDQLTYLTQADAMNGPPAGRADGPISNDE